MNSLVASLRSKFKVKLLFSLNMIHAQPKKKKNQENKYNLTQSVYESSLFPKALVWL